MSTDAVVRQLHAAGSLKWPSVALDLGAFQSYCERLCEDGSTLTELGAYAADLYLCCACVGGNAVALRVFEQEAQEVARAAIARIHRDPELVRELLQNFWQKLLVGPEARIHGYRGRGPLQAWLRVAATRLAIDHQRADRNQATREADLGECLAEQEFGPESTLIRERFHIPFRDALRHAVAKLTHKERNLLRLHIVGRCSIDQIGRAYRVHRATAARWLELARTHILESVREELELKGNHLTDSEFRSVARIVGRDLDLEVSAPEMSNRQTGSTSGSNSS